MKLIKSIFWGMGILATVAIALVTCANYFEAKAKSPKGHTEETNNLLYKKHFHDLPIEEQTIPIECMLGKRLIGLRVYSNGDFLIVYGDKQQWFSFDEHKFTDFSSFFVKSAYAGELEILTDKNSKKNYGRLFNSVKDSNHVIQTKILDDGNIERSIVNINSGEIVSTEKSKSKYLVVDINNPTFTTGIFVDKSKLLTEIKEGDAPYKIAIKTNDEEYSKFLDESIIDTAKKESTKFVFVKDEKEADFLVDVHITDVNPGNKFYRILAGELGFGAAEASVSVKLIDNHMNKDVAYIDTSGSSNGLMGFKDLAGYSSEDLIGEILSETGVNISREIDTMIIK